MGSNNLSVSLFNFFVINSANLLSECLTKTFPPEFYYRRYALPYAPWSKWLHKSECTKVA